MAPFSHSKVGGGFTKEMPRLTVVVSLLLLAVLIWLHFFGRSTSCFRSSSLSSAIAFFCLH